MADLNFPADRTELNPAGTGPLQTGDEYTANGTTWVYDATVGAWGSGASGEALSDLYLSRVNDDTAAGAITFEEPSTHEGGVSVTGGTAANLTNGVLSDANGLRLIHNGAGVLAGNNGLLTSAVSLAGTTVGGNNVKDGVKVSSVFVGTSATASGITSDCDISDFKCSEYRFYNAGTSQGDPNPAKTFGVSSCYYAPASTAVGRNSAYAFYTDYALDGTKNYGFYAAGTAPNYFQGKILTTTAKDHTPIGASGSYLFGVTAGNAGSSGAWQMMSLEGGGNNTRVGITFSAKADSNPATAATLVGSISTRGTSGVRYGSSDGSPVRIAASAENVSNATALTFNASNLVKLLQPKQFELGGRLQLGFLAPEIQSHIPLAVEENVDEEAETSQKEYDPLALIPVLTKALQEALDKIETLETRLSDAGIA